MGELFEQAFSQLTEQVLLYNASFNLQKYVLYS